MKIGNRIVKEIVFRVRLTTHQRKKLKAYAQKRGVTESFVIQQYIDRLPNAKEEGHL